MTIPLFRNSTDITFRRLHVLGIDGREAHDGQRSMTEHVQSENSPRKRRLEAAQKELAKFERRENEFLKKERQERAADLNLYLDNFTARTRRKR